MSTPRTIPEPTDALGEVLHLLRLTGTLYCRSELRSPWGIDLPPFEGSMMFHIVTAGQYWLEVEGAEPLQLSQGSLALVPHGDGHRIASAPGAGATPLFDIPVEQVSERYEIMRHGGDGAVTHMICVVVRFDHVAAQQLVSLLPRILHIDTWEEDENLWLQSALRYIAREAKALEPGGETVITRLADILVIQMIRSWLNSGDVPKKGWLSALRDERVGKALALIHRNPAKGWTVEALARECHMSRSAFAARFTDLVGEPVLRYLTKWRLQVARLKLRESSDPLSVISEHVGYESEAAFCRAFKRMFGVTAGSQRQSGRLNG